MQPPILKISIIGQDTEQLTVTISYHHELTILNATVKLPLLVTPKDHESFRWYFEDFPYNPFEPDTQVAKKIEARMDEIGESSYKFLFDADIQTRAIYQAFLKYQSLTEVDILNLSDKGYSLPLEFIRDPALKKLVFLDVASITYIFPNSKKSSNVTLNQNEIKILLVISRPSQFKDVPFRSVGRRLFEVIQNSNTHKIVLKVLRPATLENLREKLAYALEINKPYTLIHFDGHGIFEDINALATGEPSINYRGYLLFENAAFPDNIEYVNGKLLGELMMSCDVHYIILNACRSGQSTIIGKKNIAAPTSRAYSSLANDLLNTGIAGCLAMRYNIFVNTASDFMNIFYSVFSQTLNIKAATATARRYVFQSNRLIRDWMVPTLYENESATSALSLVSGKNAFTSKAVNKELGFEESLIDSKRLFGSDNLFLHFENTYIKESTLLLQGWAVCGKTYVASAFAKWYVHTGGADIAVYIDVSKCGSFKAFLEKAAGFFQIKYSEQTNLASFKQTLCETILQSISTIKSFWVIDDLHTLTSPSLKGALLWTPAEILELQGFFKSLSAINAKMMLVAAGFENNLWNNNGKAFITGMTIPETYEFVSHICNAENYPADRVVLKTLIDLVQSNPLLAITCTQLAARSGLNSFREVENLIHRIRNGDYSGMDQQVLVILQTYADALYLSLNKSLTEKELDILSCSQLYQFSLSLGDLEIMSDKKMSFHFSLLEGITLPVTNHVFRVLCKYGLAYSDAPNHYYVHAILPFFLKRIYFERISIKYGEKYEQSFVGNFADMAGYIYDKFIHGDFQGFELLKLNRFNMWFSLDLALKHKKLKAAVDIFLGLVEYYERNGRVTDIVRFIDKLEPYYIDVKTGQPLNEDDGLWIFINEAKTRIAMDFGQQDVAEQLLRIKSRYQERKTGSLLTRDFQTLDKHEQITLNNYFVTTSELSLLLVRKKDPGCLSYLVRNMEMIQKTGNRSSYALSCSYLGKYYTEIDQNNEKAFEYFSKALENYPETDNEGRGASLVHMAGARVLQSMDNSISDDKCMNFINEAYSYCYNGLKMLPENATLHITQANYTMGLIFGRSVNYLDKAKQYFLNAVNLGSQHGYFSLAMVIRTELIKVLIKLEDYDLALSNAAYILKNGDPKEDGKSINYAISVISQYKNS